MSLEEFARNNAPLPAVPKGMEAVVEVGHREGTASHITLPDEASADDAALLRGAALDPNAWVITPGTRRHKRWQRYDGEWLNWWSFTFEERTTDTAEERVVEFADLAGLFKKPLPKASPVGGSGGFVFVAADLQTGKSSVHTVNKFVQAVSDAKQRVKNLRKMGHTMPVGVLLGLGDLVEGCSEHYAQQTFTVDLDRRGQVKVARRLMLLAIRELAPLFDEFIVAAVGGNHGENRRDGKSYTTFADNDDVALFEMVQEVLHDREGFEHVTFHLPDDELSACVDIAGVPVGFTHGHLLRRGGKLPGNKAQDWWTGQIMGMGAVAGAKILVTGHYHHLSLSTFGPRTHIQVPALDGGSQWWSDLTGANSPDGVLTFRVDPDHGLGWSDLLVI